VALGIETDLVSPVPPAAFDRRAEELTGYLHERLLVTAGGRLCVLAPPEVDYSRLPEEIVLLLRYDCGARIARFGLRYLVFFDLDPTHRNLGRVILPQREESFVFDRSFTFLELDVAAPETVARAIRFWRILWLGVEHIATGYDHLLFLLALLMGAAGFLATVRVVSAFTVAHSLTLGLAWYGILAPPVRLVEVAIAASIAWVALENALGLPGRRRWLLAGGFGLIHGLGFYGVVRTLGLGEAGLLGTLLGFNLGVEVGQVALVALAWGPLVWWARQRWYEPSARASSALIVLLALWWVIQRAVAG
jgi:hypothetical protein